MAAKALRFIVKTDYHGDIISIIAPPPGLLEDITWEIDDLAKRHKDLKIFKSANGYEVTPKSFLAIQNVLKDILTR